MVAWEYVLCNKIDFTNFYHSQNTDTKNGTRLTSVLELNCVFINLKLLCKIIVKRQLVDSCYDKGLVMSKESETLSYWELLFYGKTNNYKTNAFIKITLLPKNNWLLNNK